ncbi:helix-turn-helix domain-containing protein [Saccharomonospora piscinae]|uniref:helix-turn-helix domain-containing protein n=1 Tax=Saccharomonospora piscinae TaxID=687388 RepID=UPI000465C08A|nr:helix-turn-helix domain-containing protein [Saccharomonospora piscinae]
MNPLATVVKSIWWHSGEAVRPAPQLRLPTGDVELVVNLSADRFWLPGGDEGRERYPGAVLAGPYQRAYVLRPERRSQVVGVVLRPGAARSLVGAPLHELRNRHVGLDELWGADASLLRERLLAAPGPVARLRTLEHVLHDRLARSGRTPHRLAVRATACLSATPGRHGIGDLAEHLGWTARRVEQVFRSEVGLPPKVYQRLRRFRVALGKLGDETPDWSAFALEHGYSDQAHLVREFRAHCGLTPVAYVRRRGEQLNHVPLAW